MPRRRSFNVFSLSFLDVMSCGFGAVVLVFLMINHATERKFENVNRDLLSEIRKLDYEVDTGEIGLADLRQSVVDTQRRVDEAKRRRVSLEDATHTERSDRDELEAETLARREHLNALKTDVENREEEVRRLEARAEESEGSKARTFVGEGDRQYLTGLKVGGNRILLAIDKSASMLDETIVNVLRRRNMGDSRKREAAKWRRAVATSEWLMAQMPLESQFQVFTFDTKVNSLVDGDDKRWHDVAAKASLDTASKAMEAVVPSGGTNLEALVTAIAALSPPPDNVYLVIDSLPTQGAKPPRNATITGRQRLELFEDALEALPADIVVNVILFPMEGDPYAAAAYWGLARATGGAFLSPSKDWP